MINTASIDPIEFLGGTPNENDKIIWKRAYATYLLVTNKTPEECATKPIPLVALRQILGQHDQKWQAVDDDLMKTTYKMVHRMNIFLKRFRAKAWEVKVVM